MIKKILILYFICCFCIYSSIEHNQGKYPCVCFSPDRQCQTQIIDEINEAKSSLKVQAYSFTDHFIAFALIKAKKRGVDVFVILDKSNKENIQSVSSILHNGDIPVRFDCKCGIAHNKVMIIDDEKVITGSYNFSESAYRVNRENVLILNDPALAKKYSDNFNSIWNCLK